MGTAYSEDCEIDCHDNHRNEPRDDCNKQSHKTSDDASESNDRCNEGQCASDRVENECVRKSIYRTAMRCVKVRAIDFAHDHRRLVANGLGKE